MTVGVGRIAIIGSGKMASVHAQNVYQDAGAQLVAVAGGSGAKELASRFGAVSIDVDHIIQAVAGGKAVLVEKPVDLDLDRVDECIQAAGDAIDRVVVAFNRRFDPSFAAARQRVFAGELGKVEQLVRP